MNKQHKADFFKLMHSLGEIYNKKMTEVLLDIYWNALLEFDFCEVAQAMSQHIKEADNGQFMPKPADIHRLLSGDSQTRALSAWTKVEKAFVRVGIYESVVFDDAKIHAVIHAMGGWTQLGLTSQREWPFKQQEFCKRYQGLLHDDLKPYPAKLIGIIEHENMQKGFAYKEPLLLGHQAQALRVYQGGCDRLQLESRRLGKKIKSLAKNN